MIDYANTVLKKNQLSGLIKLGNLDSKEPEPTTASGEFDATVDTYADLSYINTADISGTVNYLVKADETANNGYTQDILFQHEISIDLAFENAPLTNANETTLQAFALI